MMSRSQRIYLAAILAAILLGGSANAATADDSQVSIRGILYVSYPGDLSFDVMFAADVDVLLINATSAVEQELVALKQKLLPSIRAQENAVTKAIIDVRAPSPGDKLKEKQEVLKRERLKLEKLRSNYETAVSALLDKSATQRTKTDKKGNFKFAAILPGRYFLNARYELQGTEIKYFWFYPVEPKAGEEVDVSLNRANTMHLYDLQ